MDHASDSSLLPTTNQAQIVQRREDWKAAVEAGDVERVMSFYAPGDEYVGFDIMPPLQFVGWDAFRTNWINFFQLFDDIPTMEFKHMRVTCSGDVAFVHGFTRIKATMNGQPLDIWTRETNCLRKIDGTWLLVHDHVSVPTDFDSGKALLDLRP